VISEQYAKERGIGEDVREGKRSLMVIHSMNKKDASSDRLNSILNLQTNDEKLLIEAIDILKNNGSVQYAKDRAARMMQDAWKELDPAIPNSKAKNNIEQLSHYLIDRDI
jgi:geranylgeranyl pyrophosphate synthase